MINKDKFAILIGGKVLSCKSTELTLSAEESTKEYSTDWATPISPKSYKLSASALIRSPGGIVRDMLNVMSGRYDVTIQKETGKLPRKMKKAYRSDYPRNTKWVRKVANYIRRNIYHARNAELIVTPEYRDKLTAIIKDVNFERGDCSAVINGGKLLDVLNKFSNPKNE